MVSDQRPLRQTNPDPFKNDPQVSLSRCTLFVRCENSAKVQILFCLPDKELAGHCTYVWGQESSVDACRVAWLGPPWNYSNVSGTARGRSCLMLFFTVVLYVVCAFVYSAMSFNSLAHQQPDDCIMYGKAFEMIHYSVHCFLNIRKKNSLTLWTPSAPRTFTASSLSGLV